MQTANSNESYVRVKRRQLASEMQFISMLRIPELTKDGRPDVLIEARGNYLQLSATNKQASISSKVPIVEAVGESFVAHIKIKAIGEVLRTYNEELVTLRTFNGWLHIGDVEPFRCRLSPVAVDELLFRLRNVSLLEGCSVQSGDVKHLVNIARRISSNKFHRCPGICITGNAEEFTMLAIDGNHMMQSTVPALQNIRSRPKRARSAVSRKSQLRSFVHQQYLPVLAGMAPVDNEAVSIGTTLTVAFSCPPRSLIINTTELPEPTEWKVPIFDPECIAGSVVITVDTAEFRKAVERVRVMVSEQNVDPISIHASGNELILNSRNAINSVFTGEERVACTSSAEVVFRVCANHVLNCLWNAKESVSIHAFPDPTKPVIFLRQDGIRCVVSQVTGYESLSSPEESHDG